jgi:hypothetical protein
LARWQVRRPSSISLSSAARSTGSSGDFALLPEALLYDHLGDIFAKLRLKVETNSRGHFSIYGIMRLPFSASPH